MIGPVFLFVFFTLIIVLIKILNKSRYKQYKILIEGLKEEIILFIDQAKASTTTSWLRNGNFIFNRCDVYISEKAIIILAYTKKSFLKQLSSPIIITNNVEEYSSKFPFAYVQRISDITFANNGIKMSFVEGKLLATKVSINLIDLEENQTDVIKSFVRKNNW